MSKNECCDLGVNLNKLRIDKISCDITIRIGLKTFQAHRNVLIANMEFFAKMFNAEMRENKESIVALDSTIVCPEIFEDILNFVYTSQIKFTEKSAFLICVAANFFCYEKLLKKTEQFLIRKLKIINVSKIFSMALTIGSKPLEKNCQQFIVSKYPNGILKRTLMTWLPFENLKNCLEEFRKESKKEEMFHFIIDWVKSDEIEREPECLDLLEEIPLAGLSLKFLQEVVAKEIFLLKKKKFLSSLVEAFKDVSSYDTIYVFGGMCGTQLSSVSKFESSTGVWSKSIEMAEKRTHFGCAVIGNDIYLCGGHNGEQDLNSLEVFETKTQQFRTLKSMKHSRNGCGVVALEGFLYAAGGYEEGNRLNVVEKYEIETDDWQEVSPMQVKRNGLELVELNGFLYALGGHDGDKHSKIVECYDPKTNLWTFKASMNYENVWFGAVSFKNEIYVVGNLKSEVYDPIKDCWTEMPSPTECENGRRLVVFKDKLVVIGGKVGKPEEWNGISTVQYFDFINRVWISKKDMDVARCYHSAAVVIGDLN